MLSLPYGPDIPKGELRHHIGTFRIKDNARAAEAVCNRARRGTAAFSFSEYLHTLRSVSSLQTKLGREVDQELLSPRERDFITAYSIDAFTPDLEGYTRYLSAFVPGLQEMLNRLVPVYISEVTRVEHTYMCGTSGAGKTELLKSFMHSYVRQPFAATVVIDPAGDVCHQIAHWPECRHRLVYFHPKLAKGHLPVINPFEIYGIDPRNTSEYAIGVKQVMAQQLFSAFEQILAGSIGGAISTPMRALLFPCILTLLDYPGATLRDLRRFMHDDDELIRFGQERAHYPDVATFFRSSKGFTDNARYKQTKGSILSKLQDIFTTGIFGDLTCCKSTINLERAIEQKKVILFNLAKGHIGDEESQAFGRLVIALLQGIGMRRITTPEHKRTMTHVFIDECQNYLTPALKTIIEELRKFKMVLTMIQPVVGKGMSPDLRQVVTGIPNLQITGYMQPTERADAARLVGCQTEDTATLANGEFYIRMGRHAPFRFKNRTDLLGFGHRMHESTLGRGTVR